jgi:hypothetical protein
MSANGMVWFNPSECMGSPYFKIVVETKVSAPSSACITLSSRPVNIVKNAMGRRRVKAR